MEHELDDEALAIIDKVKKLMAVANDQQSVNEKMAENYMAKAMELLAAYNLDMAVIGRTAKGSQRKDNKLKGGLYGWQRNLWQSVCSLNFCMYWSIKGLTRGSTYEHRILGREENVISAQVMAEYLQQTVERLARDYAKRYYPGQSIFIKPMIAYREGMATRLSERLRKLRRDRLEADEQKRREQAAASRHPGSAPGTALVLADVLQTEDDLNNDYLNGWEPGTTARERAERDARRAQAQAAAEQALAERDAAEALNPALKAERLAREAKSQAEWDALMAKWAKQNEARERRRQRSGYYDREPRYRKPTAEEERASMPTFTKGYYDAEDIGLDKQVNEDRKHRIGKGE